jgi:putative peptidoglycan lipid II flippase
MPQRRSHMARSSLVVMGAFAAAKVVGLLRERAIAHQFGATAQYDAYVAAFRVPDILFTLVAGGALVSAFLPVFAGLLARDDHEEAWTIASAVTNLVFLVTAVLAALAAVAAPWLIANVIAPGFDPAQQQLCAELMRIILLSTLVFAVSGLQMGVLNAFQHFLTPALAPIAYNLGILAGAIWLAPHMGIYGLAWGVVFGALLHLGVKLPALAHYGFRYRPVLGLRLGPVREVLALLGPRIAALGTVQVSTVIATRLASALPAGSLSALNYAWVLAQMPQTLLGTAIGTVAFPTLAEHAALGRREALRDTGVGALRVMIALTVPATVGLWMLAGPAIDVLLRTGRFSAAAASATLVALRMFALGLLGHVTLEVVARVYYARKDTLTPLWLALGAMTVQITLAVGLVGPMGQGGLALANSAAVTVEVLAGIWLLARRLDGFGVPDLRATLVRAGLAGLVMAVAMAAADHAWSALVPGAAASPLWDGLGRMVVGGLVGLVAYLLAAWALGLREVRQAVSAVARRMAPRR